VTGVVDRVEHGLADRCGAAHDDRLGDVAVGERLGGLVGQPVAVDEEHRLPGERREGRGRERIRPAAVALNVLALDHECDVAGGQLVSDERSRLEAVRTADPLDEDELLGQRVRHVGADRRLPAEGDDPARPSRSISASVASGSRWE
jgi:hypothetical protein